MTAEKTKKNALLVTKQNCISLALYFRKTLGKEINTPKIQITAIIFFALSVVKSNPDLKGLSRAWYRSTARTVSVIEETTTLMKILISNSNFPSPLQNRWWCIASKAIP